LKVVPTKDLDLIKKHATFNVERINELEKTLHHDVVAFTRNVSESLGQEKK
jgi:adenylosuccinate lyase